MSAPAENPRTSVVVGSCAAFFSAVAHTVLNTAGGGSASPVGAAFATTFRPLRALDATTVDAGLANAPTKADVRAEEARWKEVRTRAACAAGATTTAERVAMVLADTRCELECVPSARERALRGRDRWRQARTSENSDVLERKRSDRPTNRRDPASFTGNDAFFFSSERQMAFRRIHLRESMTGDAHDSCAFFPKPDTRVVRSERVFDRFQPARLLFLRT